MSEDLGFILDKDPNKAAKQMIAVAGDLNQVYKEETQVLEKNDPQAFAAIQDYKYDLANTYHLGVQQMIARKAEMRTIDLEYKKEFSRLQSELNTLTSRNISALERMRKGTKRLGLIIRDATQKAVNAQRGFSYGETGRINKNMNKTVSMGINETA